jgi:hypothetical protein
LSRYCRTTQLLLYILLPLLPHTAQSLPLLLL